MMPRFDLSPLDPRDGVGGSSRQRGLVIMTIGSIITFGLGAVVFTVLLAALREATGHVMRTVPAFAGFGTAMVILMGVGWIARQGGGGARDRLAAFARANGLPAPGSIGAAHVPSRWDAVVGMEAYKGPSVTLEDAIPMPMIRPGALLGRLVLRFASPKEPLEETQGVLAIPLRRATPSVLFDRRERAAAERVGDCRGRMSLHPAFDARFATRAPEQHFAWIGALMTPQLLAAVDRAAAGGLDVELRDGWLIIEAPRPLGTDQAPTMERMLRAAAELPPLVERRLDELARPR